MAAEGLAGAGGGGGTYARLLGTFDATMYPQAGGQYVFLREAFGPLAGFLYGWTLLLVIQTGTIAAVAVAFAKFLAVLMPGLGSATVVAAVGGHAISAQQLVAVAVIALLSGANLRGLATGKRIQNVFTVAKVVALVALIVLGFAAGRSDVVAANLADPFDTSHARGFIVGSFGAAMVGALFSSDAWNNVTFTAAEVRDPRCTLPRALLIGTGLVTVLYLATNLAYLSVLPANGTPDGATALVRGIAYATDDRVATALLFYALTVAGLLVLRARHGVVVGRLLPVGFIVVAAAVCVDLLIVKPEYTWPGFVIVALGVPAFYLWRRIRPQT